MVQTVKTMEFPENYTIERKSVKHARIKVSANQGVHVIIPEHFSAAELQALLHKKQPWIEKHLQSFAQRKKRIPLHRNHILLLGNRYTYYYDGAYARQVIINHTHKTIRAKRNLLDPEIQHNWYKIEAKKLITRKVAECAQRHQFSYNQVFIRNQHTKLGNCSGKKNLSFNWRLLKAPECVIDYVVIHELVHTAIMNHTTQFWTTIKSLYPDYKQAIEWLETYGNNL
jgi:predicted metal-dependent hydrolase